MFDGLSEQLTWVGIDLRKRKRFSRRRRISAASSASARLLKKSRSSGDARLERSGRRCAPDRGCREATGVRKFISTNGKSPAAKAELFLVCGDGRTRTAVQTPHQAAFYMLSLALVFDQGLPSDRLPRAYPLGLGEV